MQEAAIIDLRDRKNPPPDDPDKAPFGYRWDTKNKEWVVKRSAGGRKSGAAWFGKLLADPEPDPVMQPFEKQFKDSDPEPAHMKASTPKAPRRSPRVTKAVKDDMSAAVAMIGMLTGPALMSKDPYCGGVLMENMQKITDALVPILCRSNTVVAFFSDTSENGWMLWFQLAIAFAPVAVAIGRHHIVKTIELQQDEATGDIFAVPRDMSQYTTEEEIPA